MRSKICRSAQTHLRLEGPVGRSIQTLTLFAELAPQLHDEYIAAYSMLKASLHRFFQLLLDIHSRRGD